MGQLRSKLEQLGTTLREVQKDTDDLCDKLLRAMGTSNKTMETFAGGYDLLYGYICEKVKAAGEKIDAHKKDTIDDFNDSEVKGFVKGIEESRQAALDRAKAWMKLSRDGNDLIAGLKGAESAIQEIDGLLEKKQKKLLKSKDLKKKLKDYQAELDDLRKMAAQQLKQLESAQFGSPDREKVLDDMKLTPKTTVDVLQSRVNMTIRRGYAEDDVAETEKAVRQWRRADFAAEIRFLKKMAAEADEIEESSDQ